MMREVLQWAFPIAVFMVVAIWIYRSGGSPLWKVVLAMLGLVGIAIALASMVEWLY